MGQANDERKTFQSHVSQTWRLTVTKRELSALLGPQQPSPGSQTSFWAHTAGRTPFTHTGTQARPCIHAPSIQHGEPLSPASRSPKDRWAHSRSKTPSVSSAKWLFLLEEKQLLGLVQ